MKRVSVSLFCLVLAAGCVTQGSGKNLRPNQRVLQHVVMFTLNEDTSSIREREILREMEALPGKIPEILNLEFGPDVSSRDLNHGFQYCAVFSFKDEMARDVYLPHPDHQLFVRSIHPHLAKDGLLVFDYWAERK